MIPEEDAEERQTCFIMMPITTRLEFHDRYSARADHFQSVLEHLLIPAVEAAGYRPIRPVVEGTRNIQASIINELLGSDMVLIDLSTHNANVSIEMGVRIALDLPMCLIFDGHDELPFDVSTINAHKYNPEPGYGSSDAEIEDLVKHLKGTKRHAQEMRNPVWRFFGAAADHALSKAKLRPEDATIDAKLDLVLGRLSAIDRTRALDLTRDRPHPNWSGLTEQRTSRIASLVASVIEDTYDVDRVTWIAPTADRSDDVHFSFEVFGARVADQPGIRKLAQSLVTKTLDERFEASIQFHESADESPN